MAVLGALHGPATRAHALAHHGRGPAQAHAHASGDVAGHAAGHARTSGRSDAEELPRHARDRLEDALDPTTRRLAELAPPIASPALVQRAAPAEEVAPRARVSMEELLPQLVRRIAWAGDRRRGSVQLELGAGPHAGTTITVHADDGRVRVVLDGAGAAELRSRIEARLARRGLVLESVT